MCDNDFTTISIIMVFMSQYDNYHDSKSNDKMQNLILITYLIYEQRHTKIDQNNTVRTICGQHKSTIIQF